MQWDRVTAISSVAIALLALIFSIYQGMESGRLARDEAAESREHRRLSVQPAVQYLRDLSDRSPMPGFALENRGFGPAELRDVTVFHEGAPPVRWNSEENALRALTTLGINETFVDFYTVQGRFVLPEDESIRLVATTAEAYRDPAWKDHFKSVINNLHVGFCFCSLYDECWKGSTWGPTVEQPDGCRDATY